MVELDKQPPPLPASQSTVGEAYRAKWNCTYGWYAIGPGVHVVAYGSGGTTTEAQAESIAAALNCAYVMGETS